MRTPDRRIMLVGVSVAPMILAGCAWFRPAAHESVNPTVADTALARREQKAPEIRPAPARPVERPAERSAIPPAPPQRPAQQDVSSGQKIDTGAAIITVRMTAEEEEALREQIVRDVSLATDAIAAIKGHTLTRDQADNLSMAEDFLRTAQDSISTDLARAGTLAEKARVLAEDLRSEVLK